MHKVRKKRKAHDQASMESLSSENVSSFTTLLSLQISFFFFLCPSMHFFMPQPKFLTPKSFLHPHLRPHCSPLHSLHNFREYGLITVLMMIQQALED